MPLYEGLAFRTVDLLRWGDGEGTNLSPLQVDNNFWAIIQRILAIESNPIAPNEIDHFTLTGTQLRIYMADATVHGPFVLPVASFAWKGIWSPGLDLVELDIVVVEEVGIFMVLHDHETASEFDASETNSEGPLYHQLFGVPTIYDIGFFIPGQPGASEEAGRPMFTFVATRPFYIEANAPASQVYLGLSPIESGGLGAPIQKNGVEIGFWLVDVGDNSGGFVFLSTVSFAIGDRLMFIRPADLDPDAEDLSVTIAARRGLPS